MSAKKKFGGMRDHSGPKHQPKAKRNADKNPDYQALIFTPRPDWHAFDLPAIEEKEVTALAPQHVVDSLHQYATLLLDSENAAYSTSRSGSASHKFLSTIMTSGTLEDKISALTLLVQESPVHTMKALENLVGLARKKSRNQAMMALAALKDILAQGYLLPSNRKLRAFGKQPSLQAALQGRSGGWTSSEPLPEGLEKVHLVVWAFEDWLKKTYFALLQILENWCGDQVEYARSRTISFVWELLKEKPEQEENLLRLLVNKLGDTDRKIASRTSYLLLQLQIAHPAMKMVILNSIEADCLFRPGQSLMAKYYGVITLNQTILSEKEEQIATRLLGIYFNLFLQLLKPTDVRPPQVVSKVNQTTPVGKKRALEHRKIEERNQEADSQLRDKMSAQVLTGVNRAFPFADTSDAAFEKQIELIFRVAHSANFNTAIQALLLLQQISATKHYGADRFYRTLYESILDPRLFSSSKQVMYLNLVYKSLKADVNAKRVQAFVKRLLQVVTMHEPPFACGILYLVSQLESAFPGIRNMLVDAEVDEEDEEEHFYDVPESGLLPPVEEPPSAARVQYDPRKRDPEHAHAERTCLWDLLPTIQHFHPSVSLFAESLYRGKEAPPKPEPAQHTLMHFLDRFVYRNPKAKQSITQSTSVMQPMAGGHAAGLLLQPGERTSWSNPLNTEAFWTKQVKDIAPDEVFFHSYFNAAGSARKRKTPTLREPEAAEDGNKSEGESQEEEIWQAIAQSRPDVDMSDEDDDLSMGDLESASGESASASEAGMDLGGDEEGLEDGEEFGEGELDGDSELDIGEEDWLDEDDRAMSAPEARTQQDKSSREQPQKKRKLKHLPTFASAEDYAKLLDDEPDDM